MFVSGRCTDSVRLLHTSDPDHLLEYMKIKEEDAALAELVHTMNSSALQLAATSNPTVAQLLFFRT